MSEKTLYSSSWYRVAELKPFVRNHAEIHRQVYRGQVWYVLEDHASGRFHRFPEETYLIIGLMNGERTLDQIWDAACNRLGEEMPTQDEMIRLLSQLHQADLLQADISPGHREHPPPAREAPQGQILERGPLAARHPAAAAGPG